MVQSFGTSKSDPSCILPTTPPQGTIKWALLFKCRGLMGDILLKVPQALMLYTIAY